MIAHCPRALEAEYRGRSVSHLLVASKEILLLLKAQQFGSPGEAVL